MKGIYIIEEIGFNKKFKEYQLYKVGYSSWIEQRLRSMPYADTNKIIHLFDKSELFDSKNYVYISKLEQEIKKEFIKDKELLVHPFENKYEMRHFHYPIDGMYDYLLQMKKLKQSQYCGNWGPTEWFIIKDYVKDRKPR